MSRKTIVLTLGVAALACSNRQHLSDAYASSYDAAFRVQAPAPAGGPARATTGLDSQEAAIVSDSYRKSLAPKDAKTTDQPVLYVAPPSRDYAQPLAPSVPKER